eukprot:Pgem_evm1s14994
MSSLSSQLRQLQPPGGNRSNFQSNKKAASILYNNRQAADVDVDTIYAMALNGLAELANQCDKFDIFEDSLFSAKFKGYDRRQMGNDEAQNLDSEVSKYLRVLSPYFLLKAAQKTLEYLIRQFRYI